MSRCKASFFVWAHRDSGLSVFYGRVRAMCKANKVFNSQPNLSYLSGVCDAY